MPSVQAQMCRADILVVATWVYVISVQLIQITENTGGDKENGGMEMLQTDNHYFLCVFFIIHSAKSNNFYVTAKLR